MTFLELLSDLKSKQSTKANLSVPSSIKILKEFIKVDMHVDRQEMKDVITNSKRVVILGFPKSLVVKTDTMSLLDLAIEVVNDGKVLFLPHRAVQELECSTNKSGLTYKLILENRSLFEEGNYQFYSFTWDA